MMIREAPMGLECCTTGITAISWIDTLRLRTEKSPASGRSASAWREFSARGGRRRRCTTQNQSGITDNAQLHQMLRCQSTAKSD
jgi:hypothetical protein